jgi:hypothetical protein
MIEAPAEIITGKVWFVDVVTEYGPGHHVAMHVTLERCAEILSANYIAVADQDCPPSIGTDKWLRVLHNSKNSDLHYLSQFAKQGRFHRALLELKRLISSLTRLSVRLRSLINNIDNNANSIVIYLDYATHLQMIAVWLSVASLSDQRNKTIVWSFFHRDEGWQRTKLGGIARWLSTVLPIKTWHTTSTSEIAAQYRKYGWNVDLLPLPLDPFLNTCDRHHKSINKINGFSKKSDGLICWLLVTRPDQGLDRVQKIIEHKSMDDFPKKFIKCFVSEKANIQENENIDLVRLPYGTQDYHLRFNECDVVLLPYNASLFRGAMSGVFTEAVATCKIPIVSDGTAMARELIRFKLDELILDFDKEFSWTLINEIRKSLTIRERLNPMAKCYARGHDTFGYAESVYKNLKKQNQKIALSDPRG